jgi:hypothetical protein
MVSKNRKMAVGTAIIALAIIAGIVLSSYPSDKKEATAFDLILTPADIGPEWEGYIHIYSDVTWYHTDFQSFCQASLLNSTYGIDIQLEALNSVVACQNEYDWESNHYQNISTTPDHTWYYDDFYLAEQSFIVTLDSIQYPTGILIVFRIDNIMCKVSCPTNGHVSHQWWKTAIITIAEMQAEKIYQNLRWT